jgi:hypothetical protein
MELTEENVRQYLRTEYKESDLAGELDEEVNSGNWLNDDWEDEFDNEFEAYQDHGRGEAENAVRTTVQEDILLKFGCENDYGKFSNIVGVDVWTIIVDEYPILDS